VLLSLAAGILRAAPVAHHAVPVHGEGHHRRQARGPDRLQGEQRFTQPAERLGDDEVCPSLGGPGHLLVERRTDLRHSRRPRLVHVGVAHVSRQQRPRFPGHPGSDRQGLPVERFEDVLLADDPQLLAVAVIGEGLDHV
jgi:hypothetical protein